MRKILITSNVEALAKDYRTNLFNGRNSSFTKPKERIKKLLEDIKDKKEVGYNNWVDYAYYLQSIFDHYDELLDLRPKEFDRYQKLYFDVDERLLKDKKWIKNKNSRKSFADTVVELMRYEDVRQKEIIPYIEKLGIHTCVYCNTQYTPTVHIKKGKVLGGYELDHNKPKSKYPFLCTSFFNLYPVCSNCNGWKLDREAEFELYTEDPSQLELFEFKLEKASIIKYMLFQNASVLKILLDSNHFSLLRNHNQLFHLEEYYSSFRDVAEELIWKSKTRNDVYKDQMIKSFNILFPRKKADVNRFLYGFYPLSQDIHRRPLTKLQQDIAKQLKIY